MPFRNEYILKPSSSKQLSRNPGLELAASSRCLLRTNKDILDFEHVIQDEPFFKRPRDSPLMQDMHTPLNGLQNGGFQQLPSTFWVLLRQAHRE